jgi:hydrogenase 3 maturation protease
VRSLRLRLKNRLKSAEKIAVLGIGSELRGDDAAGIMIAREIKKECLKNPPGRKLKVFIGDNAPENLTGEVKKFKPTHLLIIDAAEMNEAAGVVKLINPNRVSGFSSSTHNLPIKIFTDYLIKSIGCKITIIGIQPKEVHFNGCISKEIERAVADIVNAFKDEFFIIKDNL